MSSWDLFRDDLDNLNLIVFHNSWFVTDSTVKFHTSNI